MIDQNSQDDVRAARDLMWITNQLLNSPEIYKLWDELEDRVMELNDDGYNGCPCCNRDDYSDYGDDTDEST